MLFLKPADRNTISPEWLWVSLTFKLRMNYDRIIIIWFDAKLVDLPKFNLDETFYSG